MHGLPHLRRIGIRLHLELLDGIDRRFDGDVPELAGVVAGAIEREIVLIGLDGEDLTARREAGLQAEQRDHVAGLERKSLDLICGERFADRRVLRVGG